MKNDEITNYILFSFYTTLVLCICTILVYIMGPILQPILDRLFINESRPFRVSYFVTEYFVDEEKYFYLIFMHINIAIVIGMMSTVGTGAIFAVCLKCACGFFRIARWMYKWKYEHKRYEISMKCLPYFMLIYWNYNYS